MVGMAGQQQEEIETIRSRTIEVKLSDADVKRISEKAAAHGLTVGELIENFIGDLVCGTYSNGSDERMYAEQWFERCWFGMFPDLTFLRYLIEWGGLDEVIGAWENIKSTEENIQTSEEALASVSFALTPSTNSIIFISPSQRCTLKVHLTVPEIFV